MTLSDTLSPEEDIKPGPERDAGSRASTIVVVLPDADTAQACLDLGEIAAIAVGGAIAAVHIGADPTKMIAGTEEIDLQFLRERYEGTVKERVSRIKCVFDQWTTAKAGRDKIVWRDCTGDVDQCVTHESETADLLVVPRTGSLDARDVVHSILFREHKLCLLPTYRQSVAGNFLDHVLVAWKPEDNIRRTLEAAVNWLAHAQKITVVCVDDDKQGSAEAAAVEQFGRMGIRTTTVAIRSGPESVADALIGYAASIGATCIVAGAYRHGELVEMVWGQVTRQLIAHAQLPLLMMH